MDYNLQITNKGVLINDILINEKVFSDEKVEYCPVEREEQINDLFMWIGEATGSDRTNDLYLMKEDLHYLEKLDDEIIFSSISTNDFIAKSDNEEEFNKVCEEILEMKDILNLKLTKQEKEKLLYLYNKHKPLSDNLVTHQEVFKKSSNESRTYKALSKKGLVLYTGIGLISDCAYLTEKGVKVIKELK